MIGATFVEIRVDVSRVVMEGDYQCSDAVDALFCWMFKIFIYILVRMLYILLNFCFRGKLMYFCKVALRQLPFPGHGCLI